MFELMDSAAKGAVIKVIGVGGGGGNAVKHMVAAGIEGVEYICANTDAQALQGLGVKALLQLGASLTKGLGAGAKPEIGRDAALEDRDRIRELINGTDMLFITAGMGGGTGTGAAPVIAEIARDMGILTVAVVTRPFILEGMRRKQSADYGIGELAKYVDSLITIPNQKLLTSLGKNVSMQSAFAAANDVLLNAVQGISELITSPGLINVDFADVKAVMSSGGITMMGTGEAQGDDRASKAATMAISSPLLEDIRLDGSHGILVSISGGMDMTMHEFEEVGSVISQFAADDANVIIGTTMDESLGERIRVTIVATGLEETGVTRAAPPKKVAEQPKVAKLQPVQLEPVQRVAVGGSKGRYDNVLDIPTYARQGGDGNLDIPAFLRKQAD
ncbi:MAG TPA: cell division protein FtsZ [Candidatus Thiothrix moscowensis]|uniref:cell division protein FtsZ n=1 Tax=unclassified Thiothrix TaxID=2636184 RepID=UPI001A266A9D|nr:MULTISPECIES: cell division protein FtsZ [unclassified Thiothrix]MBJ6609275.1 cell division protein FtsZ [Candidatus Thiothrix moscowensis]HRJ51672.1 cell division protein FtsZ [Candidatus Thiothrix moscowensis]HRJ91987.1 cell division protein FtsZ [Candidatus Thiothrix moscowensis]